MAIFTPDMVGRMLSRLTRKGRRFRSERASFVSESAMFYKVLGKDGSVKKYPKVPEKIDQPAE